MRDLRCPWVIGKPSMSSLLWGECELELVILWRTPTLTTSINSLGLSDWVSSHLLFALFFARPLAWFSLGPSLDGRDRVGIHLVPIPSFKGTTMCTHRLHKHFIFSWFITMILYLSLKRSSHQNQTRAMRCKNRAHTLLYHERDKVGDETSSNPFPYIELSVLGTRVSAPSMTSTPHISMHCTHSSLLH